MIFPLFNTYDARQYTGVPGEVTLCVPTVPLPLPTLAKPLMARWCAPTFPSAITGRDHAVEQNAPLIVSARPRCHKVVVAHQRYPLETALGLTSVSAFRRSHPPCSLRRTRSYPKYAAESRSPREDDVGVEHRRHA